MKAPWRRFALCLLPAAASAGWQGHIDLEWRQFVHSATQAGQHDAYPSLAIDAEWNGTPGDGDWILTLQPFVRFDRDGARRHADLRQALLSGGAGDWEFRIGIGQVFWGVTESQHLVDIVNQTDLVEDPDGERKLGQPMIQVGRETDVGLFEFYLLPGFRERTFPGAAGRLRTPLVVDAGRARYESKRGERHVDAVLRWSHAIGVWDIGAYLFRGTARDPVLRPAVAGGTPVLVPYYEIVTQWGLDVQATLDAWLWKLEAIVRRDADRDFEAMVGGFEYTTATEDGADLGWLLEYHRDSRGERAPTPFQNDLFIGLRYGANDTAGSEALAGALLDLDHGSLLLRAEAGRRIGDAWKIEFVAQWFLRTDPADPLYGQREDDYLQVNLKRYF